MTRTLWAVMTISACAFAADVSGKWTGTLAAEIDGETRTMNITMDAKQEGGKLTGTIGPDGRQAAAIEKGAVEGNKLRFEIRPSPDRDEPWVFDLTVDGDRIAGDVSGEDNGVKRRGKLELKRAPIARSFRCPVPCGSSAGPGSLDGPSPTC